MAKTYKCIGNVRGWCYTDHRTITGAGRCVLSDRAGCLKMGGYTDRVIVEHKGGEPTGRVGTVIADAPGRWLVELWESDDTVPELHAI